MKDIVLIASFATACASALWIGAGVLVARKGDGLSVGVVTGMAALATMMAYGAASSI